MKIGILTFHRAINYGALLQCYALYMTLTAMGHDVEVIDYRPDSIEHDRRYFVTNDFNKKSLTEKIIYVVSCFLQFASKKKMIRIADEFLKNNVKLSKVISCGEDISKDYNYIFFGSDQIWNPKICKGLDGVYWGLFDAGKAQKVAYAASCGDILNISGDNASKIKELIGNYNAISVREHNLQTMLSKNYGIKSQVVCDPSLLLSKNLYFEMTHSINDADYIVLFLLEKNGNADAFARKIARQTNTKVLKLYANKNPLTFTPFEIRKELSPADFISYIRYARCVITDSFHATAFSIIMQTNFYTLKRQNNNGRSENLLNTVGLHNRIVDASDNIEFSEVSYNGVEEKLNEYKTHSIEYIKSSIIS